MGEYVDSIYKCIGILTGVAALKYVYDYISDWVINKVEVVSGKVAMACVNKSNPKTVLACCEVLYFLVCLSALLYLPTNSFAFCIFGITVFILASIVHYLHINLGTPLLFFRCIKALLISQNYFVKYGMLFVEQLGYLYYSVGLSLVVTVLLLHLKWPTSVYFIGYLALPIFLNIWIYLTDKIHFREDEDVLFTRRFISYSIVAVLFLQECYAKFLSIVSGNFSGSLNFEVLFYFSTMAGFVALERLFKTLADHYISYKKRNTLK